MQGLRAIAVLLVVAFHAGLGVRGGFLGVDVFFVISGFVVTGMLVRDRTTRGRLDLAAFYARRARRLLPALLVTIAVTCVIAMLIQPPNGAQQQTAQVAIGALLLSANIVIPRLAGDYFAPVATGNPLLHTWSLSVEEQFYLVFPALLWIGRQSASRRLATSQPASRDVVVVGLVSLASFALLVLRSRQPALFTPLGVFADPFYSSLTRAWEFGLGALTALAVGSSDSRARLPAVVLPWVGVAGAGAIAAASLWPVSQAASAGSLLLPTLGTVGLLVSGAVGSSWLTRALGQRWLVWIGDRSYSWYLWHWPLIVFARLLAPAAVWAPLVGAAASLALAALSFRYVEQPIRIATSFGRQQWAFLGLGGVATLAIAGGIGLGARAGWGQEWALGAHVAMRRGCAASAFDPVGCRWGVPNASGMVVLAGDSQAWAIADGLIPAAAGLGLDTVLGSFNNCPFALVDSNDASFRIQAPVCVAHNTAVLEFIAAQRPAIVVIANQSAGYVAGHVEAWHASVNRIVQEVRASGAAVILVSVTPVADADSMRTSLLIQPAGDRSTDRADRERQRSAAVEVDRRVAAANPGTLVFDPASVLCDERRCVVARAGRQFYSDINHLSRPGALLLEDGFQTQLRGALALRSAR